MKRYVILIALLCAGAMLYAEEAVLIDFAKLATDISIAGPGGKAIPQNKSTLMDFSASAIAGSSLPPDTAAMMKTSLAIENWEVVLASSSRTVENQANSYTKEAPVSAKATRYAGEKVMGVRIHFPVESFNSWALIKPPFDIPAFEATTVGTDGAITTPTEKGKYSRFEGDIDQKTGLLTGYGIVKNVGVIKMIRVDVYGLNFTHGLSVVLKDENGEERTFFMGYLRFDGWRELTWENPNYVVDVKNRELRIYPIYPKSTPFVKFGGFLITRDGMYEGGDFIGYFKDVKIIYDKAVMTTEREIDDEGLWSIIATREEARKTFEFKKFGDIQVLRYLEDLKKATEKGFKPVETTGGK